MPITQFTATNPTTGEILFTCAKFPLTNDPLTDSLWQKVTAADVGSIYALSKNVPFTFSFSGIPWNVSKLLNRNKFKIKVQIRAAVGATSIPSDAILIGTAEFKLGTDPIQLQNYEWVFIPLANYANFWLGFLPDFLPEDLTSDSLILNGSFTKTLGV